MIEDLTFIFKKDMLNLEIFASINPFLRDAD